MACMAVSPQQKCCSPARRGPRSRASICEEERLEQCIRYLCQWVQLADVIPEDSPSYARRVTPHHLVDASFIDAMVLGLAPNEPAARSEPASGAKATPEPGDVAASCLDAVFHRARAAALDVSALVRGAVRAGAADLEPMVDIAQLWRHILAFAVMCEDKERNVAAILRMPTDMQTELMQMITEVEQGLSTDPAKSSSAAGQTATADAPQSAQGLRPPASPAAPSPTAPSWALVSPSVEGVPRHWLERFEALQQESDRMRARLRLLDDQVEKDEKLRQRTNTVLDGELESFARSWQLEKQLKESEARIENLEREQRADRRALEELQQLREELQLARAKEAELAALQVKFERCSRRLEEVGEVRLELQCAVESHAAACQERDALKLQVAELQGGTQQLDAWKAKVKALELQLREAEGSSRSADKRAREAEQERDDAGAERRVLEEQVQELKLQVAALGEGGSGARTSGGFFEPFTAELRERMHSLESQNALLEQRLSATDSVRVAELVVEVENLRGLREHFEQLSQDTAARLQVAEADAASLSRRLEAEEAKHRESSSRLKETEERVVEEESRAVDLESRLASSAETCTALKEELHKQRAESSELDAKLAAAVTDARKAAEREAALADDLQAQRGQAEYSSAEATRCAAELEAVGRRATTLQEELSGVKVQLLRAEGVVEEQRLELEVQAATLEELRRECAVLEASASEAYELKRECESLAHSGQDAAKGNARMQEELDRYKSQALKDSQRALAMEGQARTTVQELENLRIQLKRCQLEKGQALREKASLVDREDRWEFSKTDMMGTIEMLRSGLADEARQSKALSEQFEAVERRSRRLEDLLERHAPAELRLLELEDDTCSRHVPFEGELTQLRAETRRLSAALAEHRLRSAEEATRLAQAMSKLRHFERQAESMPALEASARAAGAAPVDALLSIQASAAPTSHELGPTASRMVATTTADMVQAAIARDFAAPKAVDKEAPAPPQQVRAPRASILKKPKHPDVPASGATDGKENVPETAFGKPADLAQKAKVATTRRIGLIGGIGGVGARPHRSGQECAQPQGS